MVQYVITPNEAGQRLDKYLHKLLPLAPSSFLYKMLRKKNIKRNGQRAKESDRLSCGDVISLFLKEETLREFQKRETDIRPYLEAYHQWKKVRIVYENEQMLLLNKPAGLLTQKAAKTDSSLNEWMLGYLLESRQITEESLQTFHPSVMNRLDRNTGGLVICAKTLPASQELAELIRTRGIRKFYRLFVKGRLEKEQRVQAYLKKDKASNRVTICQEPQEGASPITTVYHPLVIGKDMTYLEVELITGKPHQIRAHMASVGHPLLFDPKYGDAAFDRRLKSRFPGKWQMLHAYRLEFPENTRVLNGAGGVFTAEEPDVFKKILETL